MRILALSFRIDDPQEDGRETVVCVANFTTRDWATIVTGCMYPKDLRLLSQIVDLVREQKDNFSKEKP